MKCPRCGSEELSRYRSPKTVAEMEVRRHRCSECGLISVSVQVLVDDQQLVLELLEAFEA